MNHEMNGKLIASVYWPDTETEQGRVLTASDEVGLYFSATYHGDHDEFWIIQTNGSGGEVSRHNPRYTDGWNWVEPIEPKEAEE